MLYSDHGQLVTANDGHEKNVNYGSPWLVNWNSIHYDEGASNDKITDMHANLIIGLRLAAHVVRVDSLRARIIDYNRIPT